MFTLILGAVLVALSLIFRNKTTGRPSAFLGLGCGLVVGSVIALIFI